MHLRRLLQTLHTDLYAGTERSAMTRSAAVTAGLQLLATIVTFGSSLLYARVLGPHGFGLYAYVTAWATLLTIPVALGLPAYLVREGAGRPGINRNLRRWADIRVLTVGAAIALVLVAAYWVPVVGRARILFLIAAPIPLLAALGQVRQSLLRALNRVATSQWPLVLGPLLLVLTMLSVWLWRGGLQPWEVMAAALAATALIFVVGHLQLHRVTRRIEATPPPALSLRAALPFMVMGVLFLVNSRADIILLGSLRGPHDAGIYAIVARAAAFVTFFAGAVNMVIAPRIAALYRATEWATLQRLLTASARRVLVLSLPLAVIFLVVARPLLTFLYGEPYAEGAWVLRILTLGFLSIVIAGSTAVVANMTGHERLTLHSVGVSVAVNIVLNLVLIPVLGMNGSAIATATSLVLFSGLQWYWVRSRVGLRPSALGF